MATLKLPTFPKNRFSVKQALFHFFLALIHLLNLDCVRTREKIMKSLIKLWIISVASLCIALPAWSADVTMRISLQLPLKSHLGQNLLLFKEEVESKSGGSIAIEIYDSAQLYKDKEVPAAVGSG